MKQKNLDDIKWKPVNTTDENEEVEWMKLEEKQEFTGFLFDKYPSTKYKGKYIYKFSKPSTSTIILMIGTTMLDIAMKHVEIGTPVRIKRLEDKPNPNQPNDLQQYLVEIPESE